MSSFQINGGKRLNGEIKPQGSKNEALQVICATLLTSGKVTIRNIPDILDINNLIDLLESLGVVVNKMNSSDYSFCANDININYLLTDEFINKSASLRGSLMIIGPL